MPTMYSSQMHLRFLVLCILAFGIFFFYIPVIYFLTLFLLQDGFWVQKGETRPPAGLCCSSLGCQSPRLHCENGSDLTLAPDQWKESSAVGHCRWHDSSCSEGNSSLQLSSLISKCTYLPVLSAICKLFTFNEKIDASLQSPALWKLIVT